MAAAPQYGNRDTFRIEKMMDHSEIEQNQVVDRYLMGKLTAGERQAFEDHYLACPRCLDELEAAERVQLGFKRQAAREAMAVARLGVLAALARLGWGSRLALAAMLLFLAVVPATYVKRQLAGERQPHGNVPVYFLDQVRGGVDDEPAIRVRLPASSETLVLAFAIAEADLDGYLATLRRDGEVLWRSETLEPGVPPDVLTVAFPAAFLEPDDYEVLVEGVAGEAEPFLVARYAFRVLPPP